MKKPIVLLVMLHLLVDIGIQRMLNMENGPMPSTTKVTLATLPLMKMVMLP